MIRPAILPVMMLHGIILDRGSRVPLRRQLVGHLESRILGGQIGPGRQLPSLRRAEEFLGLHRNTIASAYGDLVRSGLVRTRAGSGVYVRAAGKAGDGRLPSIVVRGRDQVDLLCPDSDLGAVLVAELIARFSLHVFLAQEGAGQGTPLRLAPSPGFVRRVTRLPIPSVVAVVSRSTFVHRLASIAVLIHGGERIGYLPVSPAKRRDLDRMRRLATLVAADYEQLPEVRRIRDREVLPLPMISAISVTGLNTMLSRFERPGHAFPGVSFAGERSLPASVQQP